METINDYMPLSHDWNEERLQTLKKLYPDLFTNEQMPNIQEIVKIFNYAGIQETERYEFRWFGKSQAKRNAFTPSNATLVYDEHRSINPTVSENIIIEGENLEVLKLLSGSYREKIKCIYIDPPYNTGKDFVYSDNFTQDKKGYWEDAEVLENGVKIDTNAETDGRYHSNWLNMMYSRLLIARQLLKEDGVIFISIDDNEVHHLRKLCDEVFGEENFVSLFPWKKRTAKSDVPFGVSQDYEWIISYAKSEFNAGLSIERKYHQTDDYPNDRWRLSDLTKQTSAEERPNSAFDLVDPKTNKIYKFNRQRVWSVTKDTFQDYYDKGKIVFPDDYKFLNTNIPSYRVFESEDKEKALKKYGSEDAIKAVSTILPVNIGMSENGNKEMVDFFGNKIFSFPKPTTLVKYFYSSINDKNALILDFFGGSGTTGQAVMELNKEDGGNRKFILVQIPEATDEKSEAYKAGFKKISDITIERNKRVVAKIENELAEKNKKKEGELSFDSVAEPSTSNYQPKTNLGFKVFKLQKSNFPRVEFAPDPELSEQGNIELLKKYIRDKEAQLVNAFNKEELLTEILLKNNFTLNYTTTAQEQFTKNEILLATDGDKETLICLDVSIEPETVDYFKVNTGQKFICLERALDTTKKYNLKHYLGDKFNAF
ncbi:site-specific DNA-methyltransferase [Flavobacterium restrictum]|uniref:site-specific DNA-methyltransferase (adenine-specific) n=1 Tax=Flavobacterium restrictum TaxID=2594428 RepID=A0A553EDB1_9FLAO|nr:site-specific DNA-methyltransferase [Flavobacterium restrictum]TRX43034.1 site-specific DNA-methyltransferase [Flavobacterium restrictum]